MDVWGFLRDRGGEGIGSGGKDVGPDGGLECGLPAPHLWGFLHSGGDACPVSIGGIAGGRSLRVGGAIGSWMGLRRVGRVNGARGSLEVAGPLVLEGWTGLRHG